MVQKNYVPSNDLLHTHEKIVDLHICYENNYMIVCFVLKVVQENDTKIVASDVKKVFTEGKVLAFLLWVVLIGFFISFIWNFVFW